jgi:hypothetical protein
MQAYEGYYENGQIYIAGQITHIKGRRRALITILDEPAQEEAKSETKQAKAWREFFEMSNSSDEEIPKAFEKVNFKREVKA